METIELTWVRPTQRTAVQYTIQVDTPREASDLLDLALLFLQRVMSHEKAVAIRSEHDLGNPELEELWR